jgi:hypothetical protein
MSKLLLRTAELAVTEHGDAVVTIRQRPGVMWLVTVGSTLVAGVAWAWLRVHAGDDADTMMNRFWAGLVTVLAVLSAVSALVVTLRRPIVVDGTRRLVLGLGGAPIAFEQIQSFRAHEVRLGGRPWARLSAIVQNEEVPMGPAVSLKELETLKAIEVRLSRLLGPSQGGRQAEPVTFNAISGAKLGGLILVTLGLLWLPLGYAFIREVLVGSPRSAHGLLVWPAGAWMIAMGGLMWTGLWAPVRLRESRNKPRDVVIGVALMASYFLVCYR